MENQREAYEVNFDGLIGPTHNFSGLAYGNLASLSSRYQTSSPRQAALQGLRKMKLLHSLGIQQGFIPPQERPCLGALRGQGYRGDDEEILNKAWDQDRAFFLNCCSASSMWAANSSTVTPSSDTGDGKVHITVANLSTYPHRAIEAGQTEKVFKKIFRGKGFVIHSPMVGEGFNDEGAANHMRFSPRHSSRGMHVFIYGKRGEGQQFPARQSQKASKRVIHDHLLEEGQALLIEQNPKAIEQGVFHNDVIAVNNEHIFLVHESAYKGRGQSIEGIKKIYKQTSGEELTVIEIQEDQLSVEEAVKSYFFNSQIVTLPNNEMMMVAPVESGEGRPRAIIDEIVRSENPISRVYFTDLRQSMANGGGPACLRLRVVVTAEELSQIHPGYLLDDQKFERLEEWINAYYRDTLHIEEINSLRLLKESREALRQLAVLFDLGRIYSFQ